MRKFFWLPLLLLILTAGPGTVWAAGRQQEKSLTADRFDVDVTIQEDGSLLITETVDYRFSGGPFTFAFRELDTDFTDGVEVLSAAVDGREYPRGDRDGQVEISGTDPIRIEYHFEPTSNTTRTFTLTYTMAGVIRQTDSGDLLRFQPLPDDFDFPIQSSTITVHFPTTAVLAGSPAITAGSGAVDQSNSTITLTARDISPDETLVFEIPFQAGALIDAPPEWQARRAFGTTLIPVWLTAAVLVLASSAAGAFVYWRRRRPDVPARSWNIDTPPTKHPPGLAGFLSSGGVNVMWHHALATLFDLAEKGHVHIEEIPKKSWFNRADFWLTRENSDHNDLHPHELSLLSLIFTDKKEGSIDKIKMSEMSKMVTSSRWNHFKDSLKDELKRSGFMDLERQRARRMLFIFGAILMVLGTLSLIFTILTASWTQGWPLFLVVSWFMGGIVSLVFGGTLLPLTDEGAGLAAEWRQFFKTLKSISRGKLTVDHSVFNKYLPYAAAAGLLAAWVKWFQKQENATLPPYFTFSSADPADGFSAFVALASTSSSSGGSAGGGAGGGAAGGGSAGAG